MTKDAFYENQVPQACTLPTVELPQRLAEFEALYASALRSQQRTSPTRLRMVLDPGAEQRARDLTSRESECCSFFTFTFSEAADGLRLEVQVPVGYVDVLDAVAAQAGRSRRGSHRARHRRPVSGIGVPTSGSAAKGTSR